MTIIYPHPKPGKKKKNKRGLPPAKLKKVYDEVMERDNYICLNPYCKDGHPLDLPHHVKKRSQGGLDEHSNLTTICIFCHRDIHHTATLKVSGVWPDFIWEIVE